VAHAAFTWEISPTHHTVNRCGRQCQRVLLQCRRSAAGEIVVELFGAKTVGYRRRRRCIAANGWPGDSTGR